MEDPSAVEVISQESTPPTNQQVPIISGENIDLNSLATDTQVASDSFLHVDQILEEFHSSSSSSSSSSSYSSSSSSRNFEKSCINSSQVKEIFLKLPISRRQQLAEWAAEVASSPSFTPAPLPLDRCATHCSHHQGFSLALKHKVEMSEAKPETWMLKSFDSGRWTGINWRPIQIIFCPPLKTKEALFKASGKVLDAVAIPLSIMQSRWEKLEGSSTIVCVKTSLRCVGKLIRAFSAQDKLDSDLSASSSSQQDKQTVSSKQMEIYQQAKRFWLDQPEWNSEDAASKSFRSLTATLLELRRQKDQLPLLSIFSSKDRKALLVFQRDFLSIKRESLLLSRSPESLRQSLERKLFFHGLRYLMVPPIESSSSSSSSSSSALDHSEKDSHDSSSCCLDDYKEASFIEWIRWDHTAETLPPQVLCQNPTCDKISSRALEKSPTCAFGWDDEQIRDLRLSFQEPRYRDPRIKEWKVQAGCEIRKLWTSFFQPKLEQELNVLIQHKLSEPAKSDQDLHLAKRQLLEDELIAKYEVEAEQEEERIFTRLSSSQLVSLKGCSQCKQVAYCSSVCQQSDWEKHKLYCRSPSSS